MTLLRKLYYRLKPGQRRLARRLFYFPKDIADKITNNRPPLVPPRGRIFTGQGDFVGMGDAYLEHFIGECGLQPHHHVLDVGCGIGRVARPLTTYLNGDGRYVGFDVVKDGVNWCKKRYKEYPNFSFTCLPLRNDLYNLDSEERASVLQFPYPDRSFNLVVLVSVFTHMQQEEVGNYLREIARVLHHGGRCFATFFVVTPSSEAFLDQEKRPFFPYRYAHFFLHDERVKNANVAYRDRFLRDVITDAGLAIEQVHEGWWAGREREECMDFQDVMILKKE